jgi:hypothetical protein
MPIASSGPIMKRCPLALSVALLIVAVARPSQAQTSVTNAGVSLGETLSTLSGVAGLGQGGEFLRMNTALEIATTPFVTPSSGVAKKLDPTTGLEVPTVNTFGPSLAERALTAGAGKIAISANVIVATYDKLGARRRLERMTMSTSVSPFPEATQTGLMSLVLSTQTTLIQGVMGATDKLDIGVVVPIVRVKLSGIAWVQNAVLRPQADGKVGPDILRRAVGEGVSTGMGDLAVTAKYRLLKFGAPPPPDAPVEPDPGGLSLHSIVRLPTGSRENLRGLGITRALTSVVLSMGKGKLKPHANVGFEWWSKGVDITSPNDPTVTARHQLQYVAGIEFAAAPKLTLLFDVLGRQILGGGKVENRTVTVAERPSLAADRFASLTYAVATDHRIKELSIAPGVKWNLKGKFLLSVSGIATVRDNGLHDLFTPVVGLDFSF